MFKKGKQPCQFVEAVAWPQIYQFPLPVMMTPSTEQLLVSFGLRLVVVAAWFRFVELYN